MKLLVFLFTASILTFGTQAMAIDVEYNRYECLMDMGWMDFRINVDEEEFFISPACGFEFENTFETQQGTVCTAKSEMCFNFELRDHMTVTCSNGESKIVDFVCDN